MWQQFFKKCVMGLSCIFAKFAILRNFILKSTFSTIKKHVIFKPIFVADDVIT